MVDRVLRRSKVFRMPRWCLGQTVLFGYIIPEGTSHSIDFGQIAELYCTGNITAGKELLALYNKLRTEGVKLQPHYLGIGGKIDRNSNEQEEL